MKLYATPFVPFGGGPLVIVGGGSAMVMLKACVAFGAFPLVAVTVPLNVPVAVGVPLITPAELRVSPVGNAPAVRRSEERCVGKECRSRCSPFHP